MSASNREYRKQVQQIQTDHAEQHRIETEKIGMINKAAEGYNQQQADFMATIKQADEQRKTAGNPGITFRHNEINN